MPTPSAQFTVNATAYTEGVAVAGASTVTLALASTFGVSTVAWSVVGNHSPDAVDPVITSTGNPSGVTASFTMPNAEANQAFLIQGKINGGLDSLRRVNPAYTFRALIGTGTLPLCVGEKLERHPTHGWVMRITEPTAASNADDVALSPAIAGQTDVQSALSAIDLSIGITPQRFGAVGDGVTDDTAAFQDAIDLATTIGARRIFLPPGTYALPSTTSLDPGEGNLAFVGQSRDSVVLLFNEGTTGSERYLFSNVTTTRKGDLTFENITFRGTLAASPRDNFGNPLYLDYYSRVELKHCRFENIAGPAMDFHFGLEFLCTDCTFEDVGRDGVRVRDTPDCVVDNCYFERIGDDFIAMHTSAAGVTAAIAAGEQVRERHIVTGCTANNVGTLKCLGAKKLVIQGNILNLVRLWGIQVAAQASSEGTNPMHDVLIDDNIITNVIGSVAPAAYIQFGIIEPRGGDATNDVIPMRYDSGSGAIIRWYDWAQADTTDADSPYPPVAGVHITDNICRRTIPVAAAFSDYGFGELLQQGTYTDAAVTDARLLVGTALLFETVAGLAGLKIHGNTFEHAGGGVRFPSDAGDELGLIDGVLRDNTFFDISGSGVLVSPSAARHCGLLIEDNVFNLDFYRRASNSNLNGTYDASGSPAGVDLGAAEGVIVRRNKFQNCCRLVVATDLTKNVVENNIAVMGTPTAMGFNAANTGIGSPIADASAYRYIIADQDPTSGTYNEISSVMARVASAMPSAGWYYAGWTVENSAPTSNGVRGWYRLTTGTAHVLGVDWLALETGQSFKTQHRLAEFYDEFMGDVLQDPWHSVAGTSATVAAILSPATNGRVRLALGNNASADMAANGVVLDMGNTNWLPSQGGLVFEARVVLDAITSVALFVGLTDQASALEMPFTLGASDTLTSNATDACGILFDTAADTDNIWLVGVANDIDATKQDSALAFSAGLFRVFRIELTSAGVATFSIDGVVIGTTMTGAVTPGVRLTPVVAGFSRTSSNRFADVDFIYMASVRA